MEEEVGRVTHFYPKISVAVVDVSGKIKVGDRIRIKGKKTDFEQVVESMQIEHKNITEAKPGDSIGLKVIEKVREGDVVYKIVE
ncbi:MAG: EF-Tu/IF-2/RF-3 family GTPase [Candidatus Nanoarchaeia archaeon]|nr:EF-Tu/IF-2/RF-3 family GTPase [Candidatus Haiyanarchaeum thermophilum]MCW1302841.1 EF-Tu/IF-2/RF-3 family GTPase [Candidatus Haiyanarchaeum thermophilum]MCW1303521.1 EF-Tu/IF-2/RF-3 family GTPase [Candidatus Haiyanarchaeum thermophilum]MCW1306701.1 EF-Tu/IF-2/RF-3 family GTPase [Candidatus Haiyanarchaeum thermophilum]MCW1307343.1 EF-Tu/IF-2/RF-3 family GTPase [Candidatus Haiyanarchaeum thermophilum]